MLAQDILLDRKDIPPDLLEFFEPSDCGACFLCHLVELFREVKRVLRDDGVAFINLGDSYAGSGQGPSGKESIQNAEARQGYVGSKSLTGTTRSVVPKSWGRLKVKDLMMMPARLAIALQEDGWYLRSEITWCKSSAMPESVRDRPTSATERIYLLSKSAQYFYDADAVREKLATKLHAPGNKGMKDWAVGPMARGEEGFNHQFADPGRTWGSENGANLRNFWLLGPEPSAWDYCNACARLFVGADRKQIKTRDGVRLCPCGASDWVAHYATFPTEIPRRAIKAGTSARGACPECHAPWVRVTDQGQLVRSNNGGNNKTAGGRDIMNDETMSAGLTKGGHIPGLTRVRETLGWQPSCRCDAGEPVPCVVMDIFSGSATTGRVARQLGRRYIGLELSDRYANASEALLAREDRPLLDAAPLPVEQQANLFAL